MCFKEISVLTSHLKLKSSVNQMRIICVQTKKRGCIVQVVRVILWWWRRKSNHHVADPQKFRNNPKNHPKSLKAKKRAKLNRRKVKLTLVYVLRMTTDAQSKFNNQFSICKLVELLEDLQSRKLIKKIRFKTSKATSMRFWVLLRKRSWIVIAILQVKMKLIKNFIAMRTDFKILSQSAFNQCLLLKISKYRKYLGSQFCLQCQLIFNLSSRIVNKRKISKLQF